MPSKSSSHPPLCFVLSIRNGECVKEEMAEELQQLREASQKRDREKAELAEEASKARMQETVQSSAPKSKFMEEAEKAKAALRESEKSLPVQLWTDEEKMGQNEEFFKGFGKLTVGLELSENSHLRSTPSGHHANAVLKSDLKFSDSIREKQQLEAESENRVTNLASMENFDEPTLWPNMKSGVHFSSFLEEDIQLSHHLVVEHEHSDALRTKLLEHRGMQLDGKKREDEAEVAAEQEALREMSRAVKSKVEERRAKRLLDIEEGKKRERLMGRRKVVIGLFTFV